MSPGIGRVVPRNRPCRPSSGHQNKLYGRIVRNPWKGRCRSVTCGGRLVNIRSDVPTRDHFVPVHQSDEHARRAARQTGPSNEGRHTKPVTRSPSNTGRPERNAPADRDNDVRQAPSLRARFSLRAFMNSSVDSHGASRRDQQREVLGHLAALDGLDADLLQRVGESRRPPGCRRACRGGPGHASTRRSTRSGWSRSSRPSATAGSAG